MQAIQLTRDSKESRPKVSYTSLPIPKATPGHALVKIYYSTINPSDRLNLNGFFPHTTFPRVPGRDYSGVIIDGPPHRIGEEVYGTSGRILGFETDGPHAEYCLVPESGLIPKPKTLSFLQAATVGVPYRAALLCLRRARTTEQDIVLVLGANGAVGSAAVQIAKAMRCQHVICVTLQENSDVNLTSDPELHTIKTLTSGKGVSVVVDTVGNLDLMKSAVNQLASRGRYTLIAAPRGGASTEFTFDIFEAYRKEIELIGCNNSNYTAEDVAADMTQLKEWFESETITAKSDDFFETIPLEEAVENGYKREPGGRPIVISMVSRE